MKVETLRATGGLDTIRTDKPDDMFVICSSYEPRTLAVVESLSLTYRARFGIIYFNSEFIESYETESMAANISILKDKLGRHCEEVITVEGSWLDAKSQLLKLREGFLKAIPDELQDFAVTMDVTTFNRESLLTAIVLLRALVPRALIRVIYTSPEDHGDWLSRGFRSIRNIIGFPGIQQPSLPTLLLVLSGFEPDRILKIIEEHEPSKVLLGIGDPPTAGRFLERNKSEQALILARQDVECFEFPASQIKTCFHALENKLTSYLGKYNIILAPMSTKLSTIAVLLLAEKHPEMQITYCLPGSII